jgi:RES domain-containing protein
VIRALYLADSEPTAWAEWYRHTAELGVPPSARLPRDAWQIEVHIDDVADLTAAATLRRRGVRRLQPTRAQWPITQPIGEACWAAGYRAVIAPSAAHEGGRVLAVFRPIPGPISGLTALPPPASYAELPAVPTGLRT